MMVAAFTKLLFLSTVFHVQVDERGEQSRSTIHSAHFAIEFDTPPAAAQALLTRAETTYDAVIAFCRRLGIPVHAPPAPLRIVLHHNPAHYERDRIGAGLHLADVTGFYDHDRNVVVLLDVSRHPTVQRIDELLERIERETRPGDSDIDGEKARKTERTRLRDERDTLVERITRLVVQHEVAHQVLFNIGVFNRGDPTPPDWLNEGLACLFEVPLGDTRHQTLPVNEMRLADLCTVMTGGEAEARSSERGTAVAAARDTGPLLPTRVLIGRNAFEASNPQVQSLRYAQSWALVYYLTKRFPNQFAAFLSGVSSPDRDDPDSPPADRSSVRRHTLETFERHIGAADTAFDRAWAEFVHGCCRDLRRP